MADYLILVIFDEMKRSTVLNLTAMVLSKVGALTPDLLLIPSARAVLFLDKLTSMVRI